MASQNIAEKTEQTERLKRNEEKWSSLLMKAGFTVFPSIILDKQEAFGLDPIDVNILLQLASYWWFSDNPPHPSKARIARSIGKSTSTFRRHIARMESEGLIRREQRFTERKSGGQDANAYYFDGLIEKAKEHAEDFIRVRELQRIEEDARRRRKKPKLVVDNTAKDTKAKKV